MTDKTEQIFVRDITLIKNLLSHILIQGKQQNEAIKALSNAGLEPKEIADILGTSSNNVSVVLYQSKKKK